MPKEKKDKKPEVRKKYRFKGRNHFMTNEDGDQVQVKHGDVVELTESQFKAWKDKFQAVSAPVEPLEDEDETPETPSGEGE